MINYIDFFNNYVMGSVQMAIGFYLLTRFLKKKVKLYFYFFMALLGMAVVMIISSSGIIDFLIFLLLLTGGGIFICRGDGKAVVLYAALTVEIMQLSYGIVNSVLGILYPYMHSFDQKSVGIAFMLAGNLALLVAVFCCYIVRQYFAEDETLKKQYVLMILTPILMLFFIDKYISSIIYGTLTITDGRVITIGANHFQVLMMQLLGMASLFCILFAYKKMLESFRLSTELSLLEQEEHSLNRYVEEAKVHYENTKAFRHDVKNHIVVVKGLLQKDKIKQALSYIGDMESITEKLSFPCSTNNPVVDILVGNKLSIAKEIGINVSCCLLLPTICFVRDIDFCIILSNALDNAVQACKCMKDDTEKYIDVTGRIQGDFILIEVKNSYQGGRFRPGTGFSNIKAVAEKYHGTMRIKTQGREFELSVLLIIPQQAENIPQQIC